MSGLRKRGQQTGALAAVRPGAIINREMNLKARSSELKTPQSQFRRRRRAGARPGSLVAGVGLLKQPIQYSCQ